VARRYVAPDPGELGRNAGKFVKHVVPAVVKPVHSLWHKMLGFVFLVVAVWAASKVARGYEHLRPVELILIIPLIVVPAGYGISSLLKARRISRS
jgi:hypothetical protein